MNSDITQSSDILVLIAGMLMVALSGCTIAKNYYAPTIIKTHYSSVSRPDGGVSINITASEQHLMPLTPEGPFPRSTLNYSVEVIGSGKDWTYRGQEGYFYSVDEVSCHYKHWDIGYAWVDKAREFVYFNLYWVSAPNRLRPSVINGKYRINK